MTMTMREQHCASTPEDSHCEPTTNNKRKRTRTRTGCLNCRRKKRKCDEGRPACGGCSRRKEACQWGVKVTFRAENAQTILDDHPSMRKSRRRSRRVEFVDVTDQVIRDYHSPLSIVEYEHEYESEGYGDDETNTILSSPIVQRSALSANEHTVGIEAAENERPALGESPSSVSQMGTDSAIANLLYFSRGGPGPGPGSGLGQATSTPASYAVGDPLPAPPQAPPLVSTVDSLPVDSMLGAASHFEATTFDFGDQLFTPEGSHEDGIFLPGSAYHELHSTLRNHIIQEVKSNAPTRPCSPVSGTDLGSKSSTQDSTTACSTSAGGVHAPLEQTSEHEKPQLSHEEECALWRNWIDEISPWLDKFDNERHFQHVLPTMARSHEHLRYAILALSARQLELKDPSRATDTSLALYQEAIHLLLPQLSTRTTPVIASCNVLCVLEMCSCSPKAWQRHLDGCASLMEAVGMTGFDGGLEQALFWCFARMDVCGGLISSVKTLIPTNHWASKAGLEADVALFKSARGFTMWANYAVYLCAQVLDLLVPLPGASQAGLSIDGPQRDGVFRSQWMRRWQLLEEWHMNRPSEMCHVMAIQTSEASPFPTIVYSNAAAISGNQTYHTAALLMLQNRPSSIRLSPKPRSALWHARQICGISMTNHHHGAWTNSIQPLWIAGRCMSHPSEHKAILELLDRIEKESGWSTKWRANDLQEFWGDLGVD